jgi:hypothetical protein
LDPRWRGDEGDDDDDDDDDDGRGGMRIVVGRMEEEGRKREGGREERGERDTHKAKRKGASHGRQKGGRRLIGRVENPLRERGAVSLYSTHPPRVLTNQQGQQVKNLHCSLPDQGTRVQLSVMRKGKRNDRGTKGVDLEKATTRSQLFSFLQILSFCIFLLYSFSCSSLSLFFLLSPPFHSLFVLSPTSNHYSGTP